MLCYHNLDFGIQSRCVFLLHLQIWQTSSSHVSWYYHHSFFGRPHIASHHSFRLSPTFVGQFFFFKSFPGAQPTHPSVGEKSVVSTFWISGFRGLRVLGTTRPTAADMRFNIKIPRDVVGLCWFGTWFTKGFWHESCLFFLVRRGESRWQCFTCVNIFYQTSTPFWKIQPTKSRWLPCWPGK